MHTTLSSKVLRFGLIAAAALPLGACGGDSKFNRTVESVNQPVVSYSTFVYDVNGSSDSLSQAERIRLIGWLDSLNVGYGDSIAIAAGDGSVPASLHNDIAEVIARRGLLIQEDASPLGGTPAYGAVRLVVRRSTASVPGCPDWRTKQESNMVGDTSSNYGCGVNGNLAAMIANPEDLVRGQTGDSALRAETSSKAIEALRSKAPSGAGNLK